MRIERTTDAHQLSVLPTYCSRYDGEGWHDEIRRRRPTAIAKQHQAPHSATQCFETIHHHHLSEDTTAICSTSHTVRCCRTFASTTYHNVYFALSTNSERHREREREQERKKERASSQTTPSALLPTQFRIRYRLRSITDTAQHSTAIINTSYAAVRRWPLSASPTHNARYYYILYQRSSRHIQRE